MNRLSNERLASPEEVMSAASPGYDAARTDLDHDPGDPPGSPAYYGHAADAQAASRAAHGAPARAPKPVGDPPGSPAYYGATAGDGLAPLAANDASPAAGQVPGRAEAVGYAPGTGDYFGMTMPVPPPAAASGGNGIRAGTRAARRA